jgi:putative transcriptional regulator
MNLNIDLYKIEGVGLAPQRGRILISEPFLNDTYFKRSVVLLTEHSEEGSVGFVLNKPVDVSVADILEDFPDVGAHVTIGGPVQTNTVHYLHTLGEVIPNSINVLPGIFWGGDFDAVKKMIFAGQIGAREIRFFIGYSGWKPLQLEEELEQNAWVVSEIDPVRVMQLQNQNSWQKTLENLGGKYKIWINTPENPGFN